MTIGVPIDRAGGLVGGYARSSLSISQMMLLQAVRQAVLFSPRPPNRLGAVTWAKQTAGGATKDRLGSRRQALGSVPRQVPPRLAPVSLQSLRARPGHRSSPSSLSSHFTLTLLSLALWPVYIFVTLTAHRKFPPNTKKTRANPQRHP